MREVTEHKSLLFRPEGYARRDPYAHDREALHLLRQPRRPALRIKSWEAPGFSRAITTSTDTGL